jgi:hypothetical protein
VHHERRELLEQVFLLEETLLVHAYSGSFYGEVGHSRRHVPE